MNCLNYSWLLLAVFYVYCIGASPVPEMDTNQTGNKKSTLSILDVSAKPNISERPCIIGPPPPHERYYGYLTECGCPCNNTAGGSSPSSPTRLWRIVCPDVHHLYTVMIELSTGPNSYLQVKHKQFSGKLDGTEFKFFKYNKKSVLVGLLSNDVVPASFLMGYVCIARASRPLADDIFGSSEALRYMALNSNNGAFLNIARVLYNPAEILNEAVTDDWNNISVILENRNRGLTNTEKPSVSTSTTSESDHDDSEESHS